ncbi:MAG TPA: hypothetical protein VHY56_10045, partial [Candidatus Binataceae bacterium]|nr:hypothetical protein [Candidatus Binataceae bacterium]
KLAEDEPETDGKAAIVTRSLDLRYAGQGYELNIAAGEGFVAAFHEAHRRRYGYADETRTVEVVNVRMRKTVPADVMDFAPLEERPGNAAQAVIEESPVVFEGARLPCKIYDRDRLRAGDQFEGPAIVVEYSATTFLAPGFFARVDGYENLVIEGV